MLSYTVLTIKKIVIVIYLIVTYVSFQFEQKFISLIEIAKVYVKPIEN